MINVHLNGELVSCPDIAGIYARNSQYRDTERICCYGCKEQHCTAWLQFCFNKPEIKKISDFGRCVLAGAVDCPGHTLRKKNGSKEKIFKITSQVHRQLASTAHYLVKESNVKTIFVTLTFPPFQKKHKLTKHIFENEILNKYFSKFVENLCTNHNCRGYIAVRERGEKNSRVHYHLLLSIPFIRFSVLNDMWCNCIKDICTYSDHALQTRKKRVIIYEPGHALRYICKYISKCKHQESDCRIVFVSNKIIQRGKQMRQDPESILDNFKFDYMKQTSDYTTCYRITDNTEFKRFCSEFLYPFFELSAEKNHFFTANPFNSS